jgi:hypothetical protein
MPRTRGRLLVPVTAALLAVFGAGIAACGDESDPQVKTQDSTTSSTDPTATGSTGSGSCSVPGASVDAKSGAGGSAIALLTDVRTGRQQCADRVVFDFRDGGPGWSVQYEPGPFTFGESGQPLAVAGSAFLVVRFSSASGVDLDHPDAPPTYSGPASIEPQGLAHVQEIRKLSDFEGQLVWVIGVDGTRPFATTTLTGPARVSLDIA